MTGSLPTNGSPDHPGIAGSVTGEWVEVYPPDGEAPEPEEPVIGPESRTRTGPVATGLFGAALILVLLGSVLPLFRATQRFRFGLADMLDVDAWRFTTTSVFLAQSQRQATHSVPSPVPLGYPLVVAGVLLVAAAALGMRAGWRPSSLRPAKVVGVVAATFVVGFVFALGMFEVAWRALIPGVVGDPDGDHVQAAPGQGFWLLVVAALAAIVAAVLTWRLRQPEPEQARPPDWDDEDTEPAGEVPPGQPAEWPVVAVIPADERSNW